MKARGLAGIKLRRTAGHYLMAYVVRSIVKRCQWRPQTGEECVFQPLIWGRIFAVA
jgi:hypothetical protein